MTDVGYLEGVYRARNSPRHGDGGIAALAGRQHGVVAHRQLVALGLSRYAVQHRLRANRLHRVHVGVYAVGHAVLSLHGRWMAAVLACGPGAVLSHRDAAAHWGLRPDARPQIDVTSPCNSRRHRPGIRVHRTRRLDPEDRAIEEGIPVTTIARTLLDLAEVVRATHLERAMEAAERQGQLDLRGLEDLIARCPGRRGLRVLGEALAAYRPAPVTRSELERLFRDLCDSAGITRPAFNTLVAGFDVDAVWHDQRLVVELDSSFHDTTAAFERDRLRDAALQLAGYRVVRFTYRRVLYEPEAVVQTLQALLAAG